MEYEKIKALYMHKQDQACSIMFVTMVTFMNSVTHKINMGWILLNIDFHIS